MGRTSGPHGSAWTGPLWAQPLVACVTYYFLFELYTNKAKKFFNINRHNNYKSKKLLKITKLPLHVFFLLTEAEVAR